MTGAQGKITPLAQLLEWVALQHGGQLIRRTTEPYFKHLIAVADLAKNRVPLGYEIGLCHDLLEDTATDEKQLLASLRSFGYADSDAFQITSAVVELTDVFTAAAYPELTKKERKNFEAERLLTISAAAQTVKYSDLIYNIGWVLKYDSKDAKRYLKKKRLLVEGMIKGDPALRQKALSAIESGLRDL